LSPWYDPDILAVPSRGQPAAKRTEDRSLFAGRISKPGKIDLVEAPEPKITGAGQILFQPELGCLCGSDLPFFDGPGEWGPFPQKVGHSLHELIGVVVESTGQRFRAGDRVLGVPIDQMGLCERLVISEQRAIPLDPRKPREHTILAQPLGTVLFALRKIPNLLDSTVAVVGQGPIGQIFCAALRNAGARKIIAIDRLNSRLALSPKIGATDVICTAQDDPVDAVRHLTDDNLADVVIEAVGHQDQAFNLCIDLLAPGGRLLYFGVPPATLEGVRWRDLFFKNATVHTSVNPDFSRDFPLAMRWIAEGRIDLSPLVTHRFPIQKIQPAFETFRDKTDGALKVLVDFAPR
jgi:threonine dehydrogenase-like Zn-dependent dehydrogenase